MEAFFKDPLSKKKNRSEHSERIVGLRLRGSQRHDRPEVDSGGFPSNGPIELVHNLLDSALTFTYAYFLVVFLSKYIERGSISKIGSGNLF